MSQITECIISHLNCRIKELESAEMDVTIKQRLIKELKRIIQYCESLQVIDDSMLRNNIDNFITKLKETSKTWKEESPEHLPFVIPSEYEKGVFSATNSCGLHLESILNTYSKVL